MEGQGRAVQYSSATQDASPSSSPREAQQEPPQKSNRDEQIAAARRNEITLLTQLRHENILGCTKELNGTVTLERLDTTLDMKVKESLQMTLFQKLVVMRHVAQALAYLHGLPRTILHLNVQPSSIQLGSKAGIIAKLGSFGVACYADELLPLTPTGSNTETATNATLGFSSFNGPASRPHSPALQTHAAPNGYAAPSAQGTSYQPYNQHFSSSSTTASQPDPSNRVAPQDSLSLPTQRSSPIPAIFQTRGDRTPTDSPSGSPVTDASSLATAMNSNTANRISEALSSASSLSNNKVPQPLKPPSSQILASMRGAPLYNPPEAFRGEPYTTKSDVYSFGLAMTEVICGFSPFASVRSLAGLVAAIQAPAVFPDDLPPVIGDLLAKCRHMDPEKRPSFAQILATINELFVPLFVHENIPWARRFWLDHFPDMISVRWSDFASCFIRCLSLDTSPNEITFRGVQKTKDNSSGIATRRLHCLKQLFFPGLTEDTDFMRTINLWIDIDKYGHIMGTFSDESTCLENFLDGIANLIETRWFHGDATGSSGPHRLTPDTFLIRLSAPAQNSLRPPNCWFTFSLKTATGNFVRETRIQRTPGKSECVLANSARECFPSLFALVESKGKPYGLAPVPSFLQSTLHPVSAEYATDDEE